MARHSYLHDLIATNLTELRYAAIRDCGVCLSMNNRMRSLIGICDRCDMMRCERRWADTNKKVLISMNPFITYRSPAS